MKVNIGYEDFLTQDNKQLINNADLKISDNISINLSKEIVLNELEEEMVCKFLIKDSLLLTEIQTELNKEDIRELIEILKQFYNQI